MNAAVRVPEGILGDAPVGTVVRDGYLLDEELHVDFVVLLDHFDGVPVACNRRSSSRESSWVAAGLGGSAPHSRTTRIEREFARWGRREHRGIQWKKSGEDSGGDGWRKWKQFCNGAQQLRLTGEDPFIGRPDNGSTRILIRLSRRREGTEGGMAWGEAEWRDDWLGVFFLIFPRRRFALFPIFLHHNVLATSRSGRCDSTRLAARL